jgi:hypothetical protein
MWVDKVHECDLPFEVEPGFVSLMDVWECDYCKRQWFVISISWSKNNNKPARLSFVPTQACKDTYTRRGLEYPGKESK